MTDYVKLRDRLFGPKPEAKVDLNGDGVPDRVEQRLQANDSTKFNIALKTKAGKLIQFDRASDAMARRFGMPLAFVYTRRDPDALFFPEDRLMGFSVGQQVGVLNARGDVVTKMRIDGFAVGMRPGEADFTMMAPWTPIVDNTPKHPVTKWAYQTNWRGSVQQQGDVQSLTWLVGGERLNPRLLVLPTGRAKLTYTETLVQPLYAAVMQLEKNNPKKVTREQLEQVIQTWRDIAESLDIAGTVKTIIKDPLWGELHISLGHLVGLAPSDF